MRIECDNCGAKYTISDEKIAGKQSRSRCKKCGHMMLVDGTHLAAPSGGAHDEATRVFDTNTGAAPDASETETGSGWYIVLDG
ncbi:MAG: zinc-ribbon domain-containing protein, partial [Myxococcales bacterium]|nr:zinc-ribbon domain-containing protein [Myxococcales bacterium]